MNAAARLWRWSAKYPNARLAALGFVLIYGAGGIFIGVEGLGWLLLKYLTEPEPTPNWETYWKIFGWALWVFGVVVVFPLTLAAMTMIPFAAYRTIRDFFIRRHLARLSRS
jgi:hypothetical protein